METENCSICMDTIGTNKIVNFDCNHCFHYDCIFNWFMEKQENFIPQKRLHSIA